MRIFGAVCARTMAGAPVMASAAPAATARMTFRRFESTVLTASLPAAMYDVRLLICISLIDFYRSSAEELLLHTGLNTSNSDANRNHADEAHVIKGLSASLQASGFERGDSFKCHAQKNAP